MGFLCASSDDGRCYVKEIDSDLKSLQHEVGGYIEAIYPYEDPVALVCNEEGKLEIGRAHV